MSRTAALSRLTVALLALMPSILAAEVYKYHPSSPLKLGGGFSPLRPDRGFAQCLDDAAPERLSLGPPETTFEASLVKSRRELYHQLSIDASLSASYGLFSASASFSLDHEYSFGQNDIVWAIKATTDYGRYTIRSPQLNKRGRRLQNNLAAFAEQCGDEYVVQERRVASAVAIYSLHTLTERERTEVHASLGGEFTGNVFAVGGNVKYDELTQSLKDLYELKVSVYAVGGGGVTKLKDLSNKTTLADIQAVLRDYIEGLSESQATPIEFLTSSWQSVGVAKLEPPDMAFRQVALTEYYFLYRDIQIRLQRYGERLRQMLTAAPLNQADVSELAVYQTQYQELANRLLDVHTRALNCLQPDKTLCKLEVTFQPLPVIPSPVYEDKWSDKDGNDHPYFVEFSYEGPNLPAGNDFYLRVVLGDLNLPLSTRFTKIESISNNGAIQFLNTELADDGRTFKIARHWNTDRRLETLRVYYERLERVCVRYCLGI